MLELFAAGKGKKNETETRKAIWFEYIQNECKKIVNNFEKASIPKNRVPEFSISLCR